MMGSDARTVLVVLEALRPLAIGPTARGAKELLPVIAEMWTLKRYIPFGRAQCRAAGIGAGETVFLIHLREMAGQPCACARAGPHHRRLLRHHPEHIQAIATPCGDGSGQKSPIPLRALASRSRVVIIDGRQGLEFYR